jgi:N-acetylneuraminic acid mutarotase
MVRKATSLSNTKKTEAAVNQAQEVIEKSQKSNQSAQNSSQGSSNKHPKKISKKSSLKKHSSRRIKSPANTTPEDSQLEVQQISEYHAQIYYCQIHAKEKIEFLCRDKCCLRELCSFCILEHKEHINEIFSIKDLIDENIKHYTENHMEEMQNIILYTQSKSLKDFETLAEKLKILLHAKINNFKEKLIQEDNMVSDSLSVVASFKQHFKFLDNAFVSQPIEGISLNITIDAVNLLKDCIRSRDKNLSNGFCIEEEIIAQEFAKLLNNNISFMMGTQSYNSANRGIAKMLHWFEWEKRELHLFDVIQYSYKSIKLIIPFKIPPFSRSIIIPEGKIFLIGGEDPELGAKKEVYSFNVATMETDHSLQAKCPMPFKKYDFTLCYHKGFIYVICGKDSDSQVIDSCEKYDINRNQWSLIAPINKRRYASSAVVSKETDKIYLFGGRSDHHNMMMDDIEEYDISKNIWRIIKLQVPHEWTPVEVCSTIQIGPGRILIFGGSDASIEDSKYSYVFNTEDYKLEKTFPLKKAHVFVSAPFLHGNHVFAVGNEYYVKTRNIHRFNIDKLEWEIVF